MVQETGSWRKAVKPLGVFFAVLGILFLSPKIPYVGGVVRSIEAGFSAFGSAFGRGASRFLASENSLSTQLTICRDDKTALARDVVEFERLKDENAELRESLHYKETTGRSGLTARIIARSIPEDTMRVIIDKGSADGVARGSSAVVGQGIVFGTVTEVKETTSIITLLTSTASKMPSAILGKKKTIGLAEGRDGAVMSLKFIPRDVDIARADVVVTSGLGGLVPEGLLLGTVTDVVDMESAPFKEAFVAPLEDPLDWSTVLLIPPSAN
ncbi:MAG: rod shape-determining protein MreC [Patescibacteria group bacterium]|jgi:rod shape-determining protein MreC